MHTLAVETFVPVLETSSKLLRRASEHAKAKDLPEAKLAPDMFPLRLQIQLACFHARSAMIVLRGDPAPELVPANEPEDLAQLQARIAQTIEFIRSFPASAFAGAADRKIVQNLPMNRVLETDGARYLRHWSLGHFYFHVVTAYDILRHEGVELGKRFFLAHVGDIVRGAA
jgi:hypothetical protein